jgi:hypothetical protein
MGASASERFCFFGKQCPEFCSMHCFPFGFETKRKTMHTTQRCWPTLRRRQLLSQYIYIYIYIYIDENGTQSLQQNKRKVKIFKIKET